MKKRKQSGSYSFDTRFYDEQDITRILLWSARSLCVCHKWSAIALLKGIFSRNNGVPVEVACSFWIKRAPIMILTDGLFKKKCMARGALFELKPERAMVTMIPWFRNCSSRPVCPLLYNLSFCCALPSPAKLNSSGHCLVERTILKTQVRTLSP
jgi:hypothetical protein